MYALVHKNKTIAGPKNWNKAFFEFILKRKKIDFEFIPRAPTDELPFVINQDTMIYPAEIVKEDLNPLIQYHQGPSWEIKEDVAIANYQVVETKLEFAKNNFKQLLAEARYKKETESTTATIQDTQVTLDTSRDGRNIFIQKYILMGDDDTVNWKFPEGWLLLTKPDLGDIITVGAAHIQAAFDWEKQIADQIDSEQTVWDLVKYQEIINPEPDMRIEEND